MREKIKYDYKPIFHTETKENDPNLVFVIMPFKDELNPLYNEIIKPTVESIDFDGKKLRCERADSVYKPGKDIFTKIWNLILESRIVVVVLTDQNPNVFYEFGIVDTVGKKVILLWDKQGGKLPFDVQGREAIYYSSNQKDMLTKNLSKSIETHLDSEFIHSSINNELEKIVLNIYESIKQDDFSRFWKSIVPLNQNATDQLLIFLQMQKEEKTSIDLELQNDDFGLYLRKREKSFVRDHKLGKNHSKEHPNSNVKYNFLTYILKRVVDNNYEIISNHEKNLWRLIQGIENSDNKAVNDILRTPNRINSIVENTIIQKAEGMARWHANLTIPEILIDRFVITSSSSKIQILDNHSRHVWDSADPNNHQHASIINNTTHHLRQIFMDLL